MKIYKIAAICLAIGGVATAVALTPPAARPIKKGTVNPIQHSRQHLAPGIVPSSALNLTASSGNGESGKKRITAGGTNLYGYCIAGGTYGLYEFNPTGFTKLWNDPFWNPSSYSFVNLETCWYRDGKICGYLLDTDDWAYGFLEGLEYYEIDFNTGEITKEDYMEYDYEGYFITCTYDADEDMVYGYGPWDEDGESALFFKVDAKAPAKSSSFVEIKDLGNGDMPSQANFNKQCASICWNPIDGLIYGITIDGNVVTVDKTTGDQTVIMKVPTSAASDGSISGLAYSPLEDLYYWERNYSDRSGGYMADLYTIDLNTKTFTLVENFPKAEQFCNFWVIGDNVSVKAPKKPTMKSADFQGSSLNGTLTYTMPTQLMDGTTISGSLGWTLNVNGAKYSEGTANPGTNVAVPVTVTAAGNYTFDFTASQNGETSVPASYTTYLGTDRPKGPASVTLTETMIYWSKVTEGVNGGYIDPNSVTYAVYLNDNKLGETTNNIYNITIPQDVPYGDMQAAVVAIVDGKQSNPTFSNVIKAGGPWQLPVDMVCTEENFGDVVIVNANNDDETWYTYDYGNDHYWFSGQVDDGQKDGDDWIILPPIAFPNADAYYSFSIDARKHAGSVYPNTWLEVKMGPVANPDLMDEVILPTFQPQNRDFATYSNPMFKVPAAGTWYIGVRCTTYVGQLGCDVARIKVESNGYDIDGPALPTNVTVEPTSKTALEAKVSFTMPDKTLGGDDIPASSDITAKITCGDNTTTVTGKPGEATSGIVQTNQGPNVIVLQCFLGDKMGAAQEYSLYTGEQIPSYVKELTGIQAKDMMSMVLNWEAPTSVWTNHWEGGLNPETTWYNILVRSSDDSYNQTFTTEKGVTTYTVTLPEGTPQDVFTIGVQAENVAGSNGQYMALTAVMGTPLGLPMNDEFSAKGFGYQPWVSYADQESGASWTVTMLENVATDWSGNKDWALVGYTTLSSLEDECLLGLPRFSTKEQTEVTVETNYYVGVEAAEMSIDGAIYGDETAAALYTFSLTGEDSPNAFKKASVKLPARMIGQDWAQLYLHPVYSADHNYAIFTYVNVYGDYDSGILMTTDFNGSIAAVDGGIEIRGYEGQNYMISDLGGVVYAKGELDGGSRTTRVPAGVYVVKTDKRTVKVVVK